jgi:hypothetical protein
MIEFGDGSPSLPFDFLRALMHSRHFFSHTGQVALSRWRIDVTRNSWVVL